MKLNCKLAWLRALKAQGGTNVDDYGYRKDADYDEIDINRLTDEDLKVLEQIVKADKGASGVRSVTMKLSQLWKIRADPAGAVITKLEALVEALKVYVGKTPHKWLFGEIDDGQQVAWYVVKILYTPPDARNGNPASTSMTLAAMSGRDKDDKTVSWHTNEIGRSCSALLTNKGYVLETPELIENYEKECQRYAEICDKTGEQFTASGQATVKRSYYDTGLVSMEVDGLATKVVMDDTPVEEDSERSSRSGRHKSVVVSAAFWVPGQKGRFDEDEETVVALPLQPYVTVYELQKHRFLWINANNLTEYAYDAELIDKLVLEKEKKDLVSIMVTGADMKLDDIVKGKTGGIIAICTGNPGLGKTLTAEVFSEAMKRPLYCVQCSQLGTSEAELEKKLQMVLGRATRWRAILLIDEADVYIHARGNDIEQNAIVGVFLRVLEYYRGVLFMTSNRETVVDDAIMSRATAWIQYTYPDTERLKRIWTVLAAQYDVPMGTLLLNALVNHPNLGKNVSGRTVKNLLKLARLLSSGTKQVIDLSTFEYVSQFLDMDGKNRKKNDQH